MKDLEIPDSARWLMRDERMSRQDCLTVAARIIVAAELRRMADKTDGENYCILKNRADELDPPRR